MWGWLGVEGDWWREGKCRQLYLNNNKILKIKIEEKKKIVSQSQIYCCKLKIFDKEHLSSNKIKGEYCVHEKILFVKHPFPVKLTCK